jgi:hypothetical protein
MCFFERKCAFFNVVGAFAELQKATLSFVMSVSMSFRPRVTTRLPLDVIFVKYDGCLTVHLLHEIMRNTNLMQQGNFIDVFLAGHVSGTYAHHQVH